MLVFVEAVWWSGRYQFNHVIEISFTILLGGAQAHEGPKYSRGQIGLFVVKIKKKKFQCVLICILKKNY